jgi:hypothetical protein
MMTDKRSAEKTVRDIRKAAQRHYSTKDKFVFSWGVFDVKKHF